MIVKMTPELQARYEELFADISAAVISIDEDNALESKVNDLASYYRALDFLIENGENKDIDNRFFRLPLDEHPMTIDLNTRAINLGDTFKQTGLGVRGDAWAEIVFFETDRYFDTMDLYNCNILIQWQDGTTIVQEPGILKDATNEEKDENGVVTKSGKLYFGWMPSKEVTAKTGNISFNVRFYHLGEVGEDGKSAIDFNLNTQKAVVTVKDTLVIDEISLPEIDPVNSILKARRVYGSIINSMEGSTPIINVNLTSGTRHLDEDGTLTLAVEGSSTDNGTIIYEWYNDITMIYVMDEDTGKLVPYDKASYVVTSAGTYYARIGNKTDNGTRFLVTPSVYVPAASNITYAAQNMPVRGYSALPTDLPETNIAVPEKQLVNMSVEVKNPDFDKDYPAVVVYQWEKKELDGETYVAINGATTAAYVPEADAEGIYRCTAINTLNNTESKSIVSSETLVRAYPRKVAEPTIDFSTTDNCIVCTSDARLQGMGELKYQWYRTDKGPLGASQGGTNRIYDVSKYITEPNEDGYEFRCSVTHVVYEGTTTEAKSKESFSKFIKIKASLNDAGKLVYELA